MTIPAREPAREQLRGKRPLLAALLILVVPLVFALAPRQQASASTGSGTIVTSAPPTSTSNAQGAPPTNPNKNANPQSITEATATPSPSPTNPNKNPNPTPTVEATATPTATPAPPTASYSLAWDSGATPVAAGAKSTPSHQAPFTITVKISDGSSPSGASAPTVEVLSGGLGGDSTITAGTSLASTTADNNGLIHGTFTSGNRTETTTIGVRKKSGDPTSDVLTSISIAQVWSDLSQDATWSYDAYFDYDTASLITFNAAYTRSGSEVPIAGHSLDFETSSISGYQWNPNIGDLDENGVPLGDYEYKSYNDQDADTSKFDQWSGLIDWGSVTDNGDGTYNVDQTVHWDDNFIVDDVHFDAWDNDVYGPDGKLP